MRFLKPIFSSAMTVLFLSGGFSAVSQRDLQKDDVHAGLLQGKKRSMLVFSGKTHSFTMDITGKSIKPSDLPGFTNIDKQIVQSTLVPVPQHTDLTHLDPEKEKAILMKYMNYELDYYKKKLKQNYTHLQTQWLNSHGHLFLVWSFDMPKDYKLVSTQLYFSTLFFDQVVDINAPVFKANDFLRAKNIVSRLAGSLKTYTHPLDITLLTGQLSK